MDALKVVPGGLRNFYFVMTEKERAGAADCG
jgi:hypothetical protein